MSDVKAVGDVVIDPMSPTGTIITVDGQPFPYFISDEGIVVTTEPSSITTLTVKLLVGGTVTVKPY